MRLEKVLLGIFLKGFFLELFTTERRLLEQGVFPLSISYYKPRATTRVFLPGPEGFARGTGQITQVVARG